MISTMPDSAKKLSAKQRNAIKGNVTRLHVAIVLKPPPTVYCHGGLYHNTHSQPLTYLHYSYTKLYSRIQSSIMYTLYKYSAYVYTYSPLKFVFHLLHAYLQCVYLCMYTYNVVRVQYSYRHTYLYTCSSNQSICIKGQCIANYMYLHSSTLQLSFSSHISISSNTIKLYQLDKRKTNNECIYHSVIIKRPCH